MKRLCRQSTRIFLKILKGMQMLCKAALRIVQNKGRGIVASPRPNPIVKHVLKEIVIMFYRLVSQVLYKLVGLCVYQAREPKC